MATTRPRLALAIASALLVGASAPSLTTSALDTGGTSRRIGTDIESSFGAFAYGTSAVSHNAAWSVVQFDGSGSFLISATGGPSRTLPTDDWQIVSDDGDRVYRAEHSGGIPGTSEIVEHTIGRGTRTVSIEMPIDFGVTAILDVAAGVAVATVDSFSPGSTSRKTVLVDVSTGELLTPLPEGLPGTDRGSDWARLSDDGAQIVFNEYLAPGAEREIIRLDRTTGRRTVSEAITPIADVSDNGEWAAWSNDTVADGRIARLRHVWTGLELDIPIGNVADATVQATDRGRVFIRSRRTGDVQRLWAWDPGDPTATLLPAGSPGTSGVFDGMWPADDGTSVTYEAPNGNGSQRPFSTALPGVATPNASAIVKPDETYCFVAVGADAGEFVGLNITPVLAGVGGFGTVHSSNDGTGPTSNANFGAGSVDPNVGFAEVGDDGDVCFTNSEHGPVHVVVDEIIVGDSAVFRSPSASGAERIADTRIGLGGPRLSPNERRCVGAAGDPREFTAVNVTPVLAVTAGFGTVHSSDVEAGATSNVNFGPGTIDPNLAIVQIGADGRVCFTNSDHGGVDVVIDQMVIAEADAFELPSDDGAVRLVDTRIGLGGSRMAASERRCVSVVGAEPGQWVGVNVTPVLATTFGFGTIHSSDDGAGATSNVNFGPGSVDPNVAFAQVGTDREICFTNSEHGGVELVLDQLVVGTADAFRQPTERGAARLADTRLARF